MLILLVNKNEIGLWRPPAQSLAGEAVVFFLVVHAE
jgi:hypothetical protein